MNFHYFACVIFLLAFIDVAFPGTSKPNNPKRGLTSRRRIININTVPKVPIQQLIKEATCEPENRSLSLIGPNYNPTYTYYPRNVLLERCGGCCDNELTTCQNVSSNEMLFTVAVKKPEKRSDGKWEYVPSHNLNVIMYQHVQCKCLCKIKAEDCRAEDNKKYNQGTCRCDCVKQEQCPSDQQWNSTNCQCEESSL